MRTRTLLAASLLGFLATIGLAVPAHAKGPSDGTMTGPGLTTPLSLTGEESGGSLLELFGWFAAVFGQTPDPMLADAPTDELGNRYVVTWTVPGPATTDEIVQEVYPYAAGSPLVYTAPGQPFFGTERTRGGWYRASEALLDALVSRGLPAPSAATPATADAAPAASEAGESSRAVAYVVATFVVITSAFVLLGSRRVNRRRVVAT